MAFTDIFIKRPLFAIVVNTLILLIGLMAIMKLPLRQYPALESATISVTTSYSGATAELMQGFVTTPIAQAIATATGIEYLSSETVQGLSTIDARLKLNADSNQAMTEIMAKVNEVKYRLPQEATDPIITKTSGNPTAIMYIGFASDHMSIPEITDYIERSILPRLASIEGIGSLDMAGNQALSLRLWLDPLRMAAHGLTASDVVQALKQNNVQAAPGKIEGRLVSTSIKADTSIDNLDTFGEMVLKADGRRLVRVNDIASLELGAKTLDQSALQNGKPVVFIAVNASPTGNPLTIIDDVKSMLAHIEKDYPQGLTATIGFDVSQFINASIEQVTQTLLEAIAIVVLVMYLFLGSLRTILIPLVTIPLSIVGAAALMWACGFSINLLTLLAMVLAIGLVVDDAIVVVENIFRHIEEGISPIQASLIGAREIVRPVIAMTITLAAVYAPIGFLGGLTGSLFREFAFALASAVVISGVVALTLSPMMGSYIISRQTTSGQFYQFLDQWFSRLSTLYKNSLLLTLNVRFLVLLLALLIATAPAYMYRHSKNELSPVEDQGTIITLMKGPQHVNIDYTETYSNQLEQIFRKIPEYDNTFIINGPTVNESFGGVTLTTWDKRQRHANEIQKELQMLVSDITGKKVFVFLLPVLPGSTGGMPVKMVISSTQAPESIYHVVNELKHAAFKSGLFLMVDSDLNINKPVLQVRIDRDKANDLGIRMQDISDTLGVFVNEHYVNRININGRAYEVIPQVQERFRLSPQTLEEFYLRAKNGAQVPLSTVISLEQTVEPNKLFQFNQLNASTFQAIPAPGVSMEKVINFLDNYATNFFPAGFSYDWLGDSRQFVHESGKIMIAFILALFVIYLALVVQFESWRDPLIILISVPLSLFGALIPIYLGFTTINIYTQIGLVTLIGLISKHGILIVDFANQLQRNSYLNKREAIVKASSVRLRPILMTTVAMVVGLIPLVASSGAGAASRFALGVVIVVGMIVGTLFTLFVLPSFYMLLSSDHRESKSNNRVMEIDQLTSSY